MNKKVYKTVVAGSLSAVLVVSGAPGAALAAESETATNVSVSASSSKGAVTQSSSVKDETVYVKMDDAGALEGVYVVNKFEGASGNVEDPGSYASVKNLSTTDALQQQGDAVSFTGTEDTPFYYQGDLPTVTSLPWDISLSYELDGEAATPEELSGASGDLKVTLEITANTGASAEGVADFAESYLVQAQGTYDAAKFSIEDAGDATVAASGNDNLVTCIVLPGESKTFTLEGKAESFEGGSWQIAMLPLSMAVEVADMDTSELSEKTEDLEDGTSSLADGAGQVESGAEELSGGLADLLGGSSKLATGASTLSSGAGSLATGTGKVANGAASLSSSASQLSAGASQLAGGTSTLATGASQLAGGAASLATGASQLSSGASQLQAGSSAFESGLASAKQTEDYSQVEAAIAAYKQQMAAVMAGQATADTLESYMTAIVQASASYGAAKGANQALSTVQENYANIDSGIDSLASSASELSSGASSLSNSASELSGGANTLSSSANTLSSGTSKLSAGAKTLSSGAKDSASGAKKLSSGAKGVASGANDLASGAASANAGASKLEDATSQLSSGASTLADSVKGMDAEILDELQEKIDEKLGADFKAHSFVVPANTNVDAVQFVYMIDGVPAPDDEDDAASSEEAESEGGSFIDKLLALFQ